MPGHSVLQLPVPPLEAWVLRRTRHYDAGFVSGDPHFAHAHVTALGPFDPDPSPDVLGRVASIAAATAPIALRLDGLDQFPNGIIHAVPSPDTALRALTRRLVAAFPQHPPYAGRFGADVDPHVTLDAAAPGVTVASTRAALGSLLPATCRVDELQLAWWESGRCHVMARWRLGRGRIEP